MHLLRTRVDGQYRAEGGGVYSVFRETHNSRMMTDKAVTLVVGFRLKLIRSNRLMHWFFQRVCILTTPFWSGFKGFKVKLWMLDKDSKDYLGIYDWRGRQNAITYADALIRVLHAVSVGGSVWYDVYEQPFENYLAKNKLQGG